MLGFLESARRARSSKNRADLASEFIFLDYRSFNSVRAGWGVGLGRELVFWLPISSPKTVKLSKDKIWRGSSAGRMWTSFVSQPHLDRLLSFHPHSNAIRDPQRSKAAYYLLRRVTVDRLCFACDASLNTATIANVIMASTGALKLRQREDYGYLLEYRTRW